MAEKEREHVDLGAVRARQSAAQVEAVRQAVRADPSLALQAAPPPAQRTLAGYLATTGRGSWRPRGLPPVELVAPYDATLAGLIATADAAYVEVSGAAFDFEDGEPGAPGFGRLLATADEDRIVEHLSAGQPRRFARAWCLQRAAREADAQARSYAAGAEELRERLDQATDELRDRIRALFVQARDEKSRGRYDDAYVLVPTWRSLAAAYRWCLNPAAPYQPPQGSAIPADVQWAEYEAAVAIGEQRWSPPGDALDAPTRGTYKRIPTVGVF